MAILSLHKENNKRTQPFLVADHQMRHDEESVSQWDAPGNYWSQQEPSIIALPLSSLGLRHTTDRVLDPTLCVREAKRATQAANISPHVDE
jgi:hypothetical protein